MTKRLICSRATEEIVLDTWHKVKNVTSSLPGVDVYDMNFSTLQLTWLDNKCEKQYFVKSVFPHDHIYFESDTDVQMYLECTKQLVYPHNVKIEVKSNFDQVLSWCTDHFGDSLNHAYPEGEWYDKKTRNKISNTWDSQFYFKQEDQALQFALTFT